jgi:hypothetical protein
MRASRRLRSLASLTLKSNETIYRFPATKPEISFSRNEKDRVMIDKSSASVGLTECNCQHEMRDR